ncbi:hypothetical protein [Pseudobacteriovorax antillogorgiicola]|uniref:Uncharacterized protein n=1 Tax=Pseudobacteriovorax antillogorgiicola TaxID=1513793 RepID=A0A1Y6C5S8_9BACT|nr:hypothetical protein [Pseudobacteriovorax antillogorgiicola]TCS49840.1 hypothetical protein EDD56_11485 [Pseudobacteriovorax antillogorgiicola]SMF43531.1 hypothetical protein SAMN06296036_11384 [Pseudobacteriovorax antillogorgiicola]
MSKLLFPYLAFFILSSGCGDDSSDSSSADSGYTLPNISFECTVDDNSDCTSSMSGATVYAAFFSGDCEDFGSSTTVLSRGSATASCDDGGCRNADVDETITSWSVASLSAGTYSVYAFYDEDDNEVPNGEPAMCESVTLPVESNPHFASFE